MGWGPASEYEGGLFFLNFFDVINIPFTSKVMGRILGIDFGKKRTGLSTTDPLKLIVSGLETVNTSELDDFIKNYVETEDVEKLVFGKPTHKDGNPTYIWNDIQRRADLYQKQFPFLKIDYEDENFTSVDAHQILLQTVSKKKRRDKKIVDKLSAVLILQKYLGHI